MNKPRSIRTKLAETDEGVIVRVWAIGEGQSKLNCEWAWDGELSVEDNHWAAMSAYLQTFPSFLDEKKEQMQVGPLDEDQEEYIFVPGPIHHRYVVAGPTVKWPLELSIETPQLRVYGFPNRRGADRLQQKLANQMPNFAWHTLEIQEPAYETPTTG